MKRNQIAAIVILLVILPTMAIRDHSAWLDIVLGLALVGCGVIAGWPYWRGNRKGLGIVLAVAGCVAGLVVAMLFR
jgi:high-affinity Fe2+/Pb2+ permease